MKNGLIEQADLNFLLYDWLNIEDFLIKNNSEIDRETIDAFLDLSHKLARDHFLPHFKKSDQIEPYLEDGQVRVLKEIAQALKRYTELGMFSAGFSESLGGMGFPNTITNAAYTILATANGSTIGYSLLTVANARLISKFGSEEQIKQFALPQINGKWFGTMCLSEPQAGSGLGDIKTKATFEEKDELGDCYRLKGNKMWISGGDQDISENIIHLVLAKAPNKDGILTAGTAGISLFIVPKFLRDGRKNDVTVAGLNHKMGNRGISNCLLNFGEGEGAKGWLVGELGHGLRQMFMMMNEARIGVGFGGAAVAYRGHKLAVNYAKERLQGRDIYKRDDKVIPIIQHSDVKRMLLASKSYAEGSLALCLYCSKLVDEVNNVDSQKLLSLLTPVAKTFPAEFGLLANDLAIQVHGGYGYTRDFDVEQLYRDNRLNPIHEGTTGIQSLDLLGRKIIGDSGESLKIFTKRVLKTCDQAIQINLKSDASYLLEVMKNLERVCDILINSKDNNTLANSSAFLTGFGHIVVGWLWLDMAIVALSQKDEDQYVQSFLNGKIATSRYFFECELPKADMLLNFVAKKSDVVSSVKTEFF
jgi:alkylation response protein AidB-like acyl-CoA dehydrogenase